MAYATLADIQALVSDDILIQLTDDDNSGIIDQTKIDAAIQWADSIIDAYLQTVYKTPLTSPPPLIVRLSAELALYTLYSRRLDVDMPDSIKLKYDESLKILRDIQNGKAGIPGIATSSSGYKTNKTSDDRDFNKDVWDKY